MRASIGDLLANAGAWEHLPLTLNRRAREIAASLRRQVSLIKAGRYAEADADELELRAGEWEALATVRGTSKHERTYYGGIAERLRGEAAHLRGGPR